MRALAAALLALASVVCFAQADYAREQRWAHLLCGPVDLDQPASTQHSGLSTSGTEDDVIHLSRRVAALEDTVASLAGQLKDLQEQLGLSQPGQA